MNPQLEFSWTGIVLALVFSGSMGSLFWWMFSVPAPVSREVARARLSVRAWRRIMVPTFGQASSERAIEMACRLGAQQRARIYLIYVVEVPRTIALDSPLPEAEQAAAQILERASEIVRLDGLEVETIVRRARQAGEEICALADQLEIDLVVMGIRTAVGTSETLFDRTSDVVLHHAPCEVLLDRLP